MAAKSKYLESEKKVDPINPIHPILSLIKLQFIKKFLDQEVIAVNLNSVIMMWKKDLRASTSHMNERIKNKSSNTDRTKMSSNMNMSQEAWPFSFSINCWSSGIVVISHGGYIHQEQIIILRSKSPPCSCFALDLGSLSGILGASLQDRLIRGCQCIGRLSPISSIRQGFYRLGGHWLMSVSHFPWCR